MMHKDHDVRTAPDGAPALQMLRSVHFDVIVSDERMPGMTGSEFLRQASADAPPPMHVLLTGYSDMQAILQSINDGEVFRFGNKPWANDDLCRVAAEACHIAKTKPAPAPDHDTAPEETESVVLLVDEDPGTTEMLSELLSGSAPLCHVKSTAVAVIKPINQGQVYRFLTKRLRAGSLKLLVGSALRKHRTLKQCPEAAGRHAVESAPEIMKFTPERYQAAGHSTSPRGEAARRQLGETHPGRAAPTLLLPA